MAVNRPLSWVEIMDQAYVLWRSNFRPVTAIVGLSAILLAPLAVAVGLNSPFKGGNLAVFLVEEFFLMLVTNLLCLASLVAAKDALAAIPINPWESYRRALPLLLPMILTSFIILLAILLGLILFVIPGLFIVPIFVILTYPVAVFEGRFYFANLRRSWELVTGSYWKTGLIITSFFLAITAFIYALLPVVVLPLIATAFLSPTLSLQAIGALGAGFLFLPTLMIIPLNLFLLAVLYRDRVTVREGTDLAEAINTLEVAKG